MIDPQDTIRDANAALLERGDLDQVPSFFATDYVTHITQGPQRAGRDMVRAYVQRISRAFSDVTVTVDILAVAPPRVAWQRTIRATHTGAYAGFPATGKAITWRDMITSRFEEGRFAEDWLVSDLAEQLLRARKR